MLVWERRAPNLENNEKEKNKIGVTWMISVYRRKLRSLSSHWRNITWIILFLRSGNGQRVKTTWTTKREKRQQNKNKLKSQTLRDTKKMFYVWVSVTCWSLQILLYWPLLMFVQFIVTYWSLSGLLCSCQNPITWPISCTITWWYSQPAPTDTSLRSFRALPTVL